MKTIDLNAARKSTSHHVFAYKADSLDNTPKICENYFLPLVLAGWFFKLNLYIVNV